MIEDDVSKESIQTLLDLYEFFLRSLTKHKHGKVG